MPGDFLEEMERGAEELYLLPSSPLLSLSSTTPLPTPSVTFVWSAQHPAPPLNSLLARCPCSAATSQAGCSGLPESKAESDKHTGWVELYSH